MKTIRIAAITAFWVLCTTLSFAADKKVIIGFYDGAHLSVQEKMESIHRLGGRVKRAHRLVNAVSAQLPETEIQALRINPAVAYVEADSVVSVVVPAASTDIPSPEYTESWGVKRIGADVAASAGIKGAGVKVAILDTGIDYNHPDLKENYIGGYNFAYGNDDPFDDSRLSHGTHVAGIIAAKDNGTGVVGVAPAASLYALKVLNGGMMGALSDILAAIEWSIDNKVNVISMSIGAPIFSQAFQDVCAKASKAGIVLVAASGNGNAPMGDYYPAVFDSVIAVAATAADDTRASFSNYGPKVELAAPGVNIKSTVVGGGYGALSGTSQAVPHVAGVAALLFSSGLKDLNGDGSIADEIRQRMGATAHDLGDPGRDDSFGYGLVDASRAIDTAQHFKVIRTGEHFRHDPLKVSLKPGKYRVDIVNDGLKRLVVRAQDGNEYDVLSRYRFWKNATPNVSFEFMAEAESILTFYPFGKKGSSAEITLSTIH